VKKHGLIGLSLVTMLLSGCSMLQTKPTSPEYSKTFLLCVRSEWKESVHGVCTKEALKDWMVMSGI
jgi:hypothetical protein